MKFLYQPLNDRSPQPAVFDENIIYSFKYLQQQSDTFSAWLARLDLLPNSCVASLLPNSALAAAVFLAIARSGHCFLPLNTGLKPPELDSLLQRCAVQAVFCNSRTRAGVRGVPVLDVQADDPATAAGVATTPFDKSLDPRRDFVCLSTSGSTGEPKVIVRRAEAAEANLRQLASALQISPADRFLSVVPFSHGHGLTNGLMLPLACGASLVTHPQFLPRQVAASIVELGVTVVVGSPFIYQALARVIHPGSNLGDVRAWISSGAALPEALDNRLRNLGIAVRQIYGTTEAGSISISSGERGGSGYIGRPLPHATVRVVDSEGKNVPDGVDGIIEGASTGFFKGYVGGASLAQLLTPDGYYRPGDMGRFEPDGGLRLTGRSDRMINVAGVKVDPIEVQAVIQALPGIVQALVLGRLDESGLESVHALLVAESGLSAADVLRHCRGVLADYKLPRRIEFVEEIPQDLMGKSAQPLLNQ